jgi:hypothetical protein
MSGIKEAFERIGNRLNTGYCVFRGAFDNIGSFISTASIKFIIVELQIKDNYSAKWEVI